MNILTCTGCVSTSTSDTSTNASSNRLVNQQVLSSIQALRASQKITEQNRTFTYELHNKELSYEDRLSISKLIVRRSQAITINIAPAKGTNKLHQLALSMQRAEALRLYIRHFNNDVKINFSPTLTNDTINLVIGA
jgi:hypothetical protein